MKRNLPFIVFAVVATFFFGTKVSMPVMASGIERITQSQKPIPEGTWSNEDFIAEVQDGTLKVYWAADSKKDSLYWKGTANTRSVGDTDTMNKEILTSGSKTKEFQFNESTLKFKWSMLNNDHTTTLHRE